MSPPCSPATSRKTPKYFLVVVAVGYLFWGTAQTLSLKWADSLYASDGHAFRRPVFDAFPPHPSSSAQPSALTLPAAQRGRESSALQRAAGTAGESPIIEVVPLYSFGHPFTQAFFMFVAEALCLVVFLGNLARKKYRWGWGRSPTHDSADAAGAEAEDEQYRLRVGQDVSLPLNPCVFLLSCGADFFASIIQNVGMMLTYASVYQMLRGATVVWIAIISYFWLHRRFTKVECWGMCSVVLGLTLVGLSSILKSKGSTGHGDATSAAKNPLVGNLLIISAQVLHAYQGVCQERIIRLYKVPPMQIVGVEGIYGIALTLSLLAFLQLVPLSHWGHNLVGLTETLIYEPIAPAATPAASALALGTGAGATFSTQNTSWISSGLQDAGVHVRVPYDDIILAFAQMAVSWKCLVSILTYIPAGFFYNSCQLTIIKHLSAAATVMLGSLRNITVWIVCLLMPSVFGETFSFVQFLGFLLLVLGNVLFQKVWIRTFAEILPARVLMACPLLFVDAEEKKETTDVTVEAEVAQRAVTHKPTFTTNEEVRSRPASPDNQ